MGCAHGVYTCTRGWPAVVDIGGAQQWPSFGAYGTSTAATLALAAYLARVQVIWNPLRDSRQHVREAAVKALRACLVLVEKRETRYRVQWYYR